MGHLPDAARDPYGFLRWIEWARGGRSARVGPEPGTRRLEGHVVLVFATSVAFRTTIAWMLEEHGATTIVMDSVATARGVLRYFDLDAIVVGFESVGAPLQDLAREMRSPGERLPVVIALADPALLDHEGSLGATPLDAEAFDAVVRFDARERRALLACMLDATPRGAAPRR